ncbi:hypothetical protein SAMN05192554_13320 [Haloarchaeobius iranensis]|uniref:Uncharacterized protein n=2 Tax=Haloarchaeobius iranensis TaxID=996166 RepID=A0A1H0B3Z1_9EURY|nr:hypothetical protein SAMN05192554_13320 [Haloarchaeobius iranensis]
MERDEFPTLVEFQDEFGSWYRTLWRAGFTPNGPPSYWTKVDIEAALAALGDVPDDPPVTGDLQQNAVYPSLSVVHDRFESWEAALEAAGYETPVRPTQKWTADRLLDDLNELGDSLGRKPKAVDVAHDADMAAPRTYDHVFGSWNAALKEAGFSATPVGTPREYSDEELISELRSIAAEIDRRPRMTDVEEDDESPSPSVFRDRFGTWPAALAAADIEPKFERAPQYTESDLLDALRTLAERVDRPPSIGDLREFDDLPAPVTYYRRFESFTEALERSGLNSKT